MVKNDNGINRNKKRIPTLNREANMISQELWVQTPASTEFFQSPVPNLPNFVRKAARNQRSNSMECVRQPVPI